MHGGLLPVSECPETLDLWRVGSRERSRGGRERLYTMLNIHILTYRAYCSFLLPSFLPFAFLPVLFFSHSNFYGSPLFLHMLLTHFPRYIYPGIHKTLHFSALFCVTKLFHGGNNEALCFPGFVTGKTTWPLLYPEIVTLWDVRISPGHISWMKRRKYVLILGWECGMPQGTINLAGWDGLEVWSTTAIVANNLNAKQ